ncbi:MAG: hypothetical protein JXA37_01645 [Chloroflexia bacterium]|nr:hypothetical protein [Chloroflexia bacterium]
MQMQRWQRLGSRLRPALRREGRALRAGLRSPPLWALLLCSLLLFVLAHQVRRPFALDIGSRPEEIYIRGFHAAEEGGGRSYRWTRAEAGLSIPGLGCCPYRLDLSLAAPRPPQEDPPQLRLEAGGNTLLRATVGTQVQVYSVLLPAEALRGGDLELLLHSDVFIPGGDPRELGLTVDHLELRPAGGPVRPALATLLWAGLAVLLAALLVERLGWPRWAALGVGAALALALAAALAWQRPLLTPGLPYLPLALAAGWLALALLQRAVRAGLERAGAPLGAAAERALWSVLLLFLALRLAGVLHPALETWDLCFHANRLEQVLRGEVLFTITSGEWRSQETFYLPLLYVLQAPLWALLGGRLLPFKIVAVLLDTASAMLAAYIARRLLDRDRLVPWAAFLYLSVPQSYIIFSWGIVANILGQFLYLLLLGLLFSPAGRLIRRRAWLGAAALLVPALLVHPGAVLLTGALLLAWVLTAWLAPLPAFSRAALWRWAGAAVLALFLAALLYYSYFAGTMWHSIQAMRAGANAEAPAQGGFLVRGPVVDGDLGLLPVEVFSRGEALAAGVRELAAEARAYYHTWPLLLALAALPAWALQRRLLALRWAGLALVVALLFAGVGLALNLYVRYMYFLLPVVAVAGAWWLGQLARRGWAGRLLAAGSGLYLGCSGLWFWIEHVLYYSTGCR